MAKWYEKLGTIAGDAFTGGAYTKKHSAQDAARAQQEAQNQAQNYYKPYEDVGGQNYQNLASMVNRGDFNIDPGKYLNNIQMEPGYQFALKQGQDAINRQMAAQGLSGSGANMKDLMQYSTGYAGQQYGNAFNRQLETLNSYRQSLQDRYSKLSDLVNVGKSTAGTMADIAQNRGNISAAKNIVEGEASPGAAIGRLAGAAGAAYATANGFPMKNPMDTQAQSPSSSPLSSMPLLSGGYGSNNAPMASNYGNNSSYNSGGGLFGNGGYLQNMSQNGDLSSLIPAWRQ